MVVVRLRGCAQLIVGALDAEVGEVAGAVGGVEVVEVEGESAGRIVGKIGQAVAGGGEDHSGVTGGEFLEQRLHGNVAQVAGGGLEWFESYRFK